MTKMTGRKQFVVGTQKGADFTPMEMELLVLKLAKWFNDPKCDRKFDDPEQAAKDTVSQCLLAETKDGKPWSNCPHEFSKRIKVKAAYDMDTDTGIPISSVKHPMAVRSLDKDAADGAKSLDQINAATSDFDIESFRAEQEKTILGQFPELENPVHLPHVRRLTLLYAQQEMMDRELLMQPRKRKEILKEMESLSTTVDGVMKTLDIHPDSLRKKIKERTEGTLGDLVSTLSEDTEFKKREKLWALQAALQFWYMANHPNGRGDGPQLTDWEVWHMTRSVPMKFTCRCGAHYQSLIRGFTPKELRDYLISEGVLIERPAIPNLILDSDLVGIHEAIEASPDVIMPDEDGPARPAPLDKNPEE